MKKKFVNQLRAQFRKPGFQPSNKSELARLLSVRTKDRADFRRALADLVNRGEVVQGKKARYRLADRAASKEAADHYPGRIGFSRDGKRSSAFFYPEDASKIPQLRDQDRPRLFIAGRHTGTAMEADRVSVRIVKSQPPKWHKHAKGKSSRKKVRVKDKKEKWEGRVVSVLARERDQVVGIFHLRGKSASLVPEDSRMPRRFRLLDVMKEAKPGDMVVADFVKWDHPDQDPVAKMVEVLGRPDDAGVDILAVIHRYGLPLEFPKEVQAEAEAISEQVTEEDIGNREDWRDKEVFTIDPEDARDFDDAISVRELDGGNWELAVHIADVSHYVKPGSALDRESRKRGNSVYLADRVIPMLPEKLSNGICSLKADVERLTHASIITFDKGGRVKKVRFISAVIRSARRYSYEEAFERLQLDDKAIDALDDKEERQLSHHIKRAWKLASILRKRRFEQGALDLDFPEVKVIVDDQGDAVGVKRSEYDESHQLIEEFMLVANEAVAKEIRDAGKSSVYRVHEDPDPEKLQEFAELARTFGHQVGDVSHRPELQKLLKNVRGKLEEHSVKIALLKSMKRAVYSKDPLGHYGLSKTNYTHFTSPIRRYADLVVHRVLRRIMSERGEASAPKRADKTPSEAQIADFADHISKTERIAADAEKETQQLKMIEYLEKLANDKDGTSFDGTVYEVRPMGAFIELDGLMVKGMIRKQDLPERDRFYFDNARNQFVGGKGNKTKIAAGSKLKVRLANVNRERGFVDFALVE